MKHLENKIDLEKEIGASAGERFAKKEHKDKLKKKENEGKMVELVECKNCRYENDFKNCLLKLKNNPWIYSNEPNSIEGCNEGEKVKP